MKNLLSRILEYCTKITNSAPQKWSNHGHWTGCFFFEKHPVNFLFINAEKHMLKEEIETLWVILKNMGHSMWYHTLKKWITSDCFHT